VVEEGMEPNPARVKLTYDDFLLFPDDGRRHELIDGEHYVTPCPNLAHQRVLGNLYFLIRAWLEQRPVGQVLLSPFDVVFTRFDVVEPDLLYVSRERAPLILTQKHFTGAPDIVVEIASPSTRKRDATIKLRLYERSGVAEYWIVDPERKLIRQYCNRDGKFEVRAEFGADAGDVLRTTHFDGLELSVAKIFAE
jgi:Uma2 family endonuclease